MNIYNNIYKKNIQKMVKIYNKYMYSHILLNT